MKRKIKILHVQITDNYGGIESLLTNIYSDIDRKKFQFDFITTAKKPYQDKLKSLGANIYLMPSIKNTVLYIKTFPRLSTQVQQMMIIQIIGLGDARDWAEGWRHIDSRANAAVVG